MRVVNYVKNMKKHSKNCCFFNDFQKSIFFTRMEISFLISKKELQKTIKKQQVFQPTLGLFFMENHSKFH